MCKPQASFMSLTTHQYKNSYSYRVFVGQVYHNYLVIYRPVVVTSGCFRIFTVVNNVEISILIFSIFLHFSYYFLSLNFQVKCHTVYNFDTCIVRLSTRIIRPIYFHYCHECFRSSFLQHLCQHWIFLFFFKCFSV